MTKEFPMTNAEFSLITRASGGESRGLPSRRQRGFHRLATLCWERIGHWGYWSFTGHCVIGHWSFAPNANPLEMSRNRDNLTTLFFLHGSCGLRGFGFLLQWLANFFRVVEAAQGAELCPAKRPSGL